MPKHQPRTVTNATRNAMRGNGWKRCGGCGRKVKVPDNPRGRVCRKCGEPLSAAREI